MLRNVAVVLVNGFLPFEFGTICEVFGVDRTDDGLPSYDFARGRREAAPLRAHIDFTIQPSCGLEQLEEADLIALPAVGDDRLSIYAVPKTPKRPEDPKCPEYEDPADPEKRGSRPAGLRSRTRPGSFLATCLRRCAGRWIRARGY